MSTLDLLPWEFLRNELDRKLDKAIRGGLNAFQHDHGRLPDWYGDSVVKRLRGSVLALADSIHTDWRVNHGRP